MSYKHYLVIALFSTLMSNLAWSSNYLKEKEEMPQAIIGISTYLGHMTNGADSSAFYGGASLYAFVFNGAIEARSNKDGFDNDNQIQLYMGIGLGRFLQIQRGVDHTTTNRIRIVSEIAFDEWVDTRNHFTLQGFAEKIDTSSEHDTRYGIALGYTF
ncbi:hypothetical protein A9R00_05825 [Oleispira antarctica]|uniref:Uncharacterized protein n=1 Tax=Oleispira antarctica TaxID=188908 RepID=A0A1Y5HT89_OLEAN|nr:hypothetical protein A9R00_05825 [Oleispira antarctica]